MDMYLSAAILGVVEGITEFLPISSTGHLIIVNQFVKFQNEQFEKMFDIVIQLGAILAALIYFRDKLIPLKAISDPETRRDTFDLWFKCAIGVIPACIAGLLFGKLVEAHMMNIYVVSTALVFGGIAIIALESADRKPVVCDTRQVSYKLALLIGIAQCLAMFFPGTSRSAATIIGAMIFGASRMVAAEFSFFLGIPTMMAATGYSLLKHGSKVQQHEWIALGIGFTVSFFVAWAVIAVFIKFIQTRNFKPFGVYRIALGLGIVIVCLLTGFRPGHGKGHEQHALPAKPAEQMEQAVQAQPKQAPAHELPAPATHEQQPSPAKDAKAKDLTF